MVRPIRMHLWFDDASSNNSAKHKRTYRFHDGFVGFSSPMIVFVFVFFLALCRLGKRTFPSKELALLF